MRRWPWARLTQIERFAKGRLQSVDESQARLGELICSCPVPVGRRRSCRVVRMRGERCDADAHPLVQRQRAQQAVQLGLAVGSVEAEDLRLAGPDRQLPHADEMSLLHQLGCCVGLGIFTVLDLRLPSFRPGL